MGTSLAVVGACVLAQGWCGVGDLAAAFATIAATVPYVVRCQKVAI
jgi:hypothetical protein